jgi:membrane protein YqaA with SNARE-associated domain
VKAIVNHFYFALAHMGGFGLLTLGVLDSSFLVLPLGNDLLVVAMTARKHILMPYYASMATLGSLLGCGTLDAIGRRGGERELEKHLPRKRLEYVMRRIKKNAAWALAFACLMPPPFPFTPFVVAASASNYPRKKLFAVIGVSRLARFSAEGVLAILIGERILKIARSRPVEDAILALIAISVVAGVVSVYGWIKRSGRGQRKEKLKKSPGTD